MWYLKIKKRKVQFLIVALIMFLATGILASCISFALETLQFVGDYYSYEKCPIMFTIVKDEETENQLTENNDLMKLLAKTESGNAKYVTSDMKINDTKIESKHFIWDIENREKLMYPFTFVAALDKSETEPKNYEIWVNHIYADLKNVKLGDQISFGEDNKYIVSAIVNTPFNSSGFIDQYSFYLNGKAMEDLDGMECRWLNLYAQNDNVTNKDIRDAIPEELSPSILMCMETSSLEMCLSILAGIFSGVGIVAALIIIGVSMIIVRYFVRAIIAKEFHMIGIYKAIGKNDNEIRKIYLFAYFIVGAIGSLLGMSYIKPLTIYLTKAALGENAYFHISWVTPVVSIICAIFLILFLAFNVVMELRKVRKITPVQVLTMNNQSTKEKISKSVIKNAHSSLAIAVNGMFKRKSMTILIIMVLAISLYAQIMAMAVGLTLYQYTKNRNVWENLPEYDGYISVNDDDIKVLEKAVVDSGYTDDYVLSKFKHNDLFELTYEDTKYTSSDMNPMIYDNFTEERYQNVPYLKGRICTELHETTVSADFLSKMNKSVGDYVTISSETAKIQFLIVGSYSSMIHGGTSFYINNEDAEELGWNDGYTTILFFLKDGITYEEFEEKLKPYFDTATINEDFDFISNEGKTVGDIAFPICIVLFMAFLVFCILNIINIVYTQNRENRKRNGILKALGFSTGYIQRQVMIEFSIEYAIATVIALLTHWLLSPSLNALACGVRFIRYSWVETGYICLGTYAILMILTFVMILPVRKIQPVELMEE